MSILTLSSPRGRLSLLAVCSAAMMLPLSFSAGVIATPAIALQPGASPLVLSWITNAFLLSFGSLLMAAGTLADRYGRKRLFISGVSLFTLLSLITGWVPSVVWLDGVRALQGAAAAAALAGVARRWPVRLTGAQGRGPSACWAPASASVWRPGR